MSPTDFTVTKKDEKYLITVKGIRSRNFSRNLPFLILSDTLPDGQVPPLLVLFSDQQPRAGQIQFTKEFQYFGVK